MQLPYQCRQCQCSVTTVQALMLVVVALKQPAIECLTLCLTRGINGVTLSYSYSGNSSDPTVAEPLLNKLKRSLWTSGHAWGLNPLDMPRTPYWASEGKHSQDPPCPITPPSRHHLYIIHLIDGLRRFYHITLSLKWLLVSKSDVKQQFTDFIFVVQFNCWKAVAFAQLDHLF